MDTPKNLLEESLNGTFFNLGNGIVSAFTKRSASEYSSDRKIKPLAGAVFSQSLKSISRASRIKATAGRLERRNKLPVKANGQA